MDISIEAMIIEVTGTVGAALKTIDRNAQGICFVVDGEGKLLGTLTDGDIRRALINGYGMDTVVSEVMQTNCFSLPWDAPAEQILASLNDKIRYIPLLDENGVPVDYASRFRTHRTPVMQPLLDGNELAYVSDCITSGWVSSQGTYVRKFEEVFAAYCGVPHALSVSNGTNALHLALATLGIGPGDEVIVPDFTFAASVNAVIYTGATPVLVDVDPDTWTLDPQKAAAAVTARTKAIMPVHIYGHPCDMDAINNLAGNHGLYIIEDCAESLGSNYKGVHVGSLGEVGAFSFFGNKTITTGEGGMLTFRDSRSYEKACVLRDHGMSKTKRYWHDEIGYNYRMTNLQAALGVAQMERVQEFVARKRTLAANYKQALEAFPAISLPDEKEWALNTYWLYTVLIDPDQGISREVLMEKLAKNGIETRPAFYSMHMMPVYQNFTGQRSFPVSERISKRGVSLPSYGHLTAAEQDNVIKAIENAYSINTLGK